MILSYHPILEGDVNRLCAGRDPDAEDFALMERADAILLPQGCRESLFRAATARCPHVFPNDATRFSHPGKLGDIRLFREHKIPHPRSVLFDGIRDYSPEKAAVIPFPAVLKSNYGGEGSLVFRAEGTADVAARLEMFRGMEGNGFKGFLIQEWVETDGRDLRVVVMGSRYYSYWRVQPDADEFRHNLAAGGVVDHDSDPGLQAAGVELARRLCACSGINLAGMDVLFPVGDGRAIGDPLLLEINYYFGRAGLGGLERYYELLRAAVDEWLELL